MAPFILPREAVPARWATFRDDQLTRSVRRALGRPVPPLMPPAPSSLVLEVGDDEDAGTA